MDAQRQHPLITTSLLVGAATAAIISGMQIAVRVSTSAWFGFVTHFIARPVHVQRANELHIEARRWMAATHEAFLMGFIYGAASIIVCAALVMHVTTLLGHGHWAASILCVGFVAAAFYFEANELSALRSLSWRGVKRTE